MPIIMTKQDLDKFVIDKIRKPQPKTNQIKETFNKFISKGKINA